MTLIALAMIIAAYLLGSVSSAVLICRLLRLPDPRTVGSNNPGATNVLRTGGKGAAIAVLLCDMLKGTILLAVTTWELMRWYLASLPLRLVLDTCTHCFSTLKVAKASRQLLALLLRLVGISPVSLPVLGCWLRCYFATLPLRLL